MQWDGRHFKWIPSSPDDDEDMEFDEEFDSTESDSNDSTPERSYWRIGRRANRDASIQTVRRSPRLAAQRVDQPSSGNRRNPQRSRRSDSYSTARRTMHGDDN